MSMDNIYYQGEQAQILSTFTTTFWCEACMHTRVIVASKVQSNVIHVVDYMVGDDPVEKDKYKSYLVAMRNSSYENQYLMNSLDEGHIANFHPHLMVENFNPRVLT